MRPKILAGGARDRLRGADTADAISGCGNAEGAAPALTPSGAWTQATVERPMQRRRTSRLNIALDAGRLIGFVTFNAGRDVGVAERLLAKEINPSAGQLRDVDTLPRQLSSWARRRFGN